MKSKTATDWLFEKLWDTPKDKLTWHAMLEQAKQMEKEQIIDAHNHGFTEGTCFGASLIGYKFVTSEQYYNETYGN